MQRVSLKWVLPVTKKILRLFCFVRACERVASISWRTLYQHIQSADEWGTDEGPSVMINVRKTDLINPPHTLFKLQLHWLNSSYMMKWNYRATGLSLMFLRIWDLNYTSLHKKSSSNRLRTADRSVASKTLIFCCHFSVKSHCVSCFLTLLPRVCAFLLFSLFFGGAEANTTVFLYIQFCTLKTIQLLRKLIFVGSVFSDSFSCVTVLF